MIRNYRATVEYDGTNYAGFQIQANRPTIQGELERVLQRLTQQAVRVHGAGRTDAGVHARGQVISFRADWSHGLDELQRALNALLPQDIAVREVAEADEHFHARFSASSRMYVYTVYSGPVRSPLQERFAHYVAHPLDEGAMAVAAALLEGEHDFAAFGQPPCGEDTVRVVRRSVWRSNVAPVSGWLDPALTRFSRFEIEANAFLRGMVRRVVGTLLLVGMGLIGVSEFEEIFSSGEIRRAGAPAPACGLCLWQVQYQAA